MEFVLHDLAMTSTPMKPFFENWKMSAENENMDQMNSVTSIFDSLSPPNSKLLEENMRENDKDVMIQHLKQRICQLEETNRLLTEEYSKTNIHLSKYTSPSRNVEYYHRMKELNKDNAEYKEKRKEINRRAYQKKKAKLLEKKNTSKKN